MPLPSKLVTLRMLPCIGRTILFRLPLLRPQVCAICELFLSPSVQAPCKYIQLIRSSRYVQRMRRQANLGGG
eukprot:228781-Pleurochrysis_carterae.AAC.4